LGVVWVWFQVTRALKVVRVSGKSERAVQASLVG